MNTDRALVKIKSVIVFVAIHIIEPFIVQHYVLPTLFPRLFPARSTYHFSFLTIWHSDAWVQMSKINNDRLAHTVNNNIIKCEH